MVFWQVSYQTRLRQAGNNSQIGSNTALIDSHLSALLKIPQKILVLLFLAILLLGASSFVNAAPLTNHAAGTVTTGSAYWSTNCASCHNGSPPTDLSFTGASFPDTPNNTLAFYAENPTNITTGVNAAASMTAGNRTLATNGRDDLSAYFASFIRPVVSVSNTSAVTLAPGAAYPSNKQILPVNGSDYLVNTTTYSATGLPAGVAMGSSTGVVTGNVPSNLTTVQTFNIVLSAVNANASPTTGSTSSFSITVQGIQTITFGGAPTVVVGGTGSVSTTGGNSGNAVTYSTASSACSVNSSTGVVSGLTAGTNNCTITANQSGNANYTAAAPVNQTFSIGQGSQTIAFGAAPTVTVGSTGNASATASPSGLAVTYSTASSACSVNSSTGVVSGLTAGTNNCTITANQSGNANYTAAAPVNQTFSIGQGNQTISFGAAPSVSVGGTGSVSATASPSGLAVSYGSSTPAACTVNSSSGLVAGVSGGTNNCTITADQIGNANYLAAPQATQTFSIGAGSQTVTFGTAPTVVVGGTGNVAATASSGLTVTYSTVSAGCSVNSGTGVVTGVAAGTNNCTITGTQAGNASFSTASQTQTFNIGQGSQTVSFPTSPSVSVGGTGTAVATASSGLAISYSSSTLTACTVNTSSGVVSGLLAGTNNCTITASQLGDANYTAASPVARTFSITQGNQTISFPNPGPVSAGGTVAAAATASSGLVINYASSTSTTCSVNSSTGVITGITAGTNNCTITANQAGDANFSAAAQQSVIISVTQGTQTITFGAAPTVFEGGTANVSATSTSGLAVTYSTVSPSCSVNASSGLVTGITVGTNNCTITASQAGNANYVAATPVNQTFSIGNAPVVAGAGTVQVPLNTATTFDLFAFSSGSGRTGVGLSAAPTHGTATVSGTKVTYTPTANYFGPDTLSYVVYGTLGASAPAVITLNIVGRPDPTQNANVTGIMTAQMDAAQRFNRTQLSNFQQRMEFLHRRPSTSGSSTANVDGINSGVALRPTTTLGLIEAQSASLRAQDNQVAATSANSQNNQQAAPNAATQAVAVLQPANVQAGTAQAVPQPQAAMFAYQNSPGQFADTDTGVLGLLNGPVGSSLLAALTSNSVNLAALSKGLNGSGSKEPDAVEIWVAGNLRFGSINNSGVNSGYTNFRTDGVTIGADKRFSDKLALGVGVGYAFDTAKVGTDGSKSESNGISVALYGSYQPTERTFIDGLVGYGQMKFNTNRFVAAVSDFAQADRRGDQVFASLSSGYEFREQGFMLSPYGRFDVAYTRLRDATEKGAGLNALHYDNQDSRFAQLALGLRAEATHQTNFGLAIPRARLEYQNSYQEGGDTSIRYADQLGTNYRLTGTSSSRNAVVAGVGSDFILKNGIRLALDYQTLRSVGYESSQSLSFRLAKDFGVNNSQIPFVSPDNLTMPRLGVRVDLGYTFDDNVNRAKDSDQKRADHLFGVNLTKGGNIPLGEHTRIVMSGFVGGERAYYFNGLDKVTAGGQAELQYRTSGDFLAPTFGLLGRASTEQFNSALRDGYRYTTSLTLRKPMTDRINTFSAISFIQKNAKDAVFDTKEYSIRGNVDYTFASNDTLYLTGEYRHGDIVSTGLGSLANLDGSKASARDDVFVKQNYFTYRFGGDTILTTLGYNLSVGPTDGIDFSWRRVESTPSSVPSYVAHKKSYIDNQYSIVYLIRF